MLFRPGVISSGQGRPVNHEKENFSFVTGTRTRALSHSPNHCAKSALCFYVEKKFLPSHKMCFIVKCYKYCDFFGFSKLLSSFSTVNPIISKKISLIRIKRWPKNLAATGSYFQVQFLVLPIFGVLL